MKKSYTNLILIITTIIFLFFVCAFVYFFNVIKNKNRHISAVSIALDKKIADQDNTSVFQSKITELSNTQGVISGYFIDTSKIDTFVEYLEDIGTNNNVDLSVKNVDTPKDEKNKILVNINMSGSFPNIMKVISTLENAPYNIIINSSYLNKETPVATDISIGVPKVKEAPKDTSPRWVANITFSILNI
jgi:hypothetical protein